MIEQIEIFSRDVIKLPQQLKKWNAFKELKEEIDELAEVIPIVEGLTKESIETRHWDEIKELTGAKDPKYNDHGDIVDEFCFRDLLRIPLIKHKEDIEDITDSADKQEKILIEYDKITTFWDTAEI